MKKNISIIILAIMSFVTLTFSQTYAPPGIEDVDEPDKIFGRWWSGNPLEDPIWTNISDQFDAGMFSTELDPTSIEVGAVEIGTDLNGRTYREIIEMMFYPELFPVLTSPTTVFNFSPTGLHEIGDIIDINYYFSLNRGSISPQYSAESGYRSGPLDTSQGEDGFFFDYANVPETSELSTSENTISSHVVSTGIQRWGVQSAYTTGVQPFSNQGNQYNMPLLSGITARVNHTITGVYPYFATTEDVYTLTKGPLLTHGSTIQRTMANEVGETEQVKLKVPQDWGNVSAVEVYNDLTNLWDPVAGYTVTSTTREIHGNEVNYYIITHTGAPSGVRPYRFTFD